MLATSKRHTCGAIVEGEFTGQDTKSKNTTSVKRGRSSSESYQIVHPAKNNNTPNDHNGQSDHNANYMDNLKKARPPMLLDETKRSPSDFVRKFMSFP